MDDVEEELRIAIAHHVDRRTKSAFDSKRQSANSKREIT